MIFVQELTASDVITHSAHPTGPQPGVSGRKHPSLHSPVLVDQSAEDSVTSDRGVTVDDGRGIVTGWALVEALVRPVVVEMALVLVEDGAGVSFVVDQEPVGALRTDTADESLGIAISPAGSGEGS